MLVPLSHFPSVWQCPMLSRDNSRKHDSIILSRSFPSPWVTSRAPSDHEVIRDFVLDPDSPRNGKEEVSRLFQESLDIQGHGSRYCHHSDTEALLATQAPGHGSQHPSKLELLLNVFCKKIVPNYLQRVNSSRRLRGPAPAVEVSRCEQAASPSQTETRRGVSPVRGRTPHSGHGLPSFGRFAERVLPSLPHIAIATLSTRCPHHTQPLEASWYQPRCPGLSKQSRPPRQDETIS